MTRDEMERMDELCAARGEAVNIRSMGWMLPLARDEIARLRARQVKAREIIEGLVETIAEMADHDEMVWVNEAKRWLQEERE